MQVVFLLFLDINQCIEGFAVTAPQQRDTIFYRAYTHSDANQIFKHFSERAEGDDHCHC